MVRFRCPKCRTSIEHRPERAGKMGTCDQCSTQFVEPSDPLPGMTAELWETTPAPQLPSNDSSKESLNSKAGSRPSRRSQPSSASSPSSSPKARASKLDQFDTRELLAPLGNLGLHGVLITWSAKRPGSLKLGTSSGCPKEEADRKVMEVALSWVKQRSPKLYAKLLIELAKLEASERDDD